MPMRLEGWRERERLRPREVAELLGVSTRQVYRLIQRRDLQAIRLGRCTLVAVASVVELLGERAPTTAPPGRSVRVSEEARRFVAKLREARP